MLLKIRIATRRSPLARWQAEHVAGLLLVARPDLETELVGVDTHGDRHADTPIWEMGGKGVFVKEVQAAVLSGRADIAVHSAKDLPSGSVDGLTLAAVPERGDPRDALVGATRADLPAGACIATGSVRRRAQLADIRPDLTFVGLRGNIDTRLAKVGGGVDAIAVAVAALDRLGLRDRIAEVLPTSAILPQVGQGALAVECRVDDAPTLAAVGLIEDEASRRAVDAERSFLAELGGDCDLPAGAHAVATASGLHLEGMIASLDGHVVLRHRADGDTPDLLGAAVARHLLEHGGSSLLNAS